MRAGEAGQGGDEGEPALDRRRLGEGVQLGQVLEQAQAADPFDGGSRIVDAAVDGMDGLPTDPPGTVGSRPRFGALTISVPVMARAKAPVPKVTLASPRSRQPWP